MFEKLKGYKTLIWAVWPTFVVLLMNAGVVDVGFQEWAENLWSEYYVVGVGIYGAGVVFLRSITNSPIFNKE